MFPLVPGPMQRFAPIALLALATGCSLVIDVPADCEDSNCGAYVCAADGVECLDTCSADGDCASGNVCDTQRSECTPTGCEAVFQSTALSGLPGSIGEFAASVGGPPEQLIVAAGRNEGLGFLRYNINGALVPDTPDAELGLVRLAPANEDRLPFFPLVRYVTSEDSEADGGNPRFVFAWRGATPDRDQFYVGSFVVDPTQAPRTRMLAQERARTEITSLDIRPNGQGLLAVWRAKSSQAGEVMALASDLSGDPGGASAMLVTPEELVADFPAIARLDDVFFVVHTIAGSGTRSLTATALDATGAELGTVNLRTERQASGFRIDEVRGLASDDAGAIFWVEDTGEPFTEAFLAVLDDAVVRGLDPEEPIAVPAIALGADLADRGFSDVSDFEVADDDDGFVIAWRGTSSLGRTDIWVQRFDAAGQPLFSALPAVGSGAGQVDDYDVLATSDGVALVWLVEGDSSNPDQLFYRRFECTDEG